MRQQLMEVLGTEESEDVMTDVVRRFWTRAKPLRAATVMPPRVEPRTAQVVDLATWTRMQGRRSL